MNYSLILRSNKKTFVLETQIFTFTFDLPRSQCLLCGLKNNLERNVLTLKTPFILFVATDVDYHAQRQL